MTTPAKLLRYVPGMIAGLSFVLLAVATPGALAYHRFTANCNNIWYDTAPVGRGTAALYATVGDQEGYQWGGGCWNDNNRDDQQNDPQQDPGTHGEGGDCSGFVFKSWYLNGDSNWQERGDFRYHDKMQNPVEGGPYETWDFKAGAGVAIDTIPKSNAYLMDALVSDTHIGMVYTENYPSPGFDEIIEAKSEEQGTVIRVRDYRSRTDYSGVRRNNWYVGPPTAVVVKDFKAIPGRNGIRLIWHAAVGTRVAGFNVYRAGVTDADARRVNPRLIRPRSEAGGSIIYSFLDRRTKPTVSYTYRLQIAWLDGTRSWSGSSSVPAR